MTMDQQNMAVRLYVNRNPCSDNYFALVRDFIIAVSEISHRDMREVSEEVWRSEAVWLVAKLREHEPRMAKEQYGTGT